jgi:hypothetical protein
LVVSFSIRKIQDCLWVIAYRDERKLSVSLCVFVRRCFGTLGKCRYCSWLAGNRCELSLGWDASCTDSCEY